MSNCFANKKFAMWLSVAIVLATSMLLYYCFFYGNVRKTVLENGVTVITQVNKSKIAGISLGIRHGSRYEDNQTRGYAHILEHMLFRGTKTRKSSDIKDFLAQAGSTNAFTGPEKVEFYTRQFTENVEEGLDIYLDMLQNLSVSDDDVQKELGAILQEFDMMNNRMHYREYIFMASEMFNKESNLGNQVIGNKENISNANLQKLKFFMDKYYTGKNIIISVAGDISHSKIVNLIKEKTKNINAGSKNEFKKAYFNKENKKYLFKEDKSKTGVSVSILINSDFFYKLYNDANSAKIARMNIINNIFATEVCDGGFESRFFKNLREKMGLIYTSDCGYGAHEDVSYYYITIDTSYNNAKTAYKAMVDELFGAIGSLTQKEFDYEIGSREPSYVINAEIGDIRDTSLVISGINLSNEFYQRGKKITNKESYKIFKSINRDDVNRFSKEIFLNEDIRPAVLVYGEKDPNLDYNYLINKIEERRKQLL